MYGNRLYHTKSFFLPVQEICVYFFSRQFLRSQPELDRALFIRRYWHLESIAALAQSFHLRESQVKSRLFRTRQRLKAALEQEGIAV